jgi:hypothetical protein
MIGGKMLNDQDEKGVTEDFYLAIKRMWSCTYSPLLLIDEQHFMIHQYNIKKNKGQQGENCTYQTLIYLNYRYDRFVYISVYETRKKHN